MAHSQREVVRHYERQRARAFSLVETARALRDRCAARRRDLEAEVKGAALALAAAYLADLAAPALARAEQLTGFRGFSRRDPHRAMARERATLHREVRDLAADPRYVEREALAGPQGSLRAELADVQAVFTRRDAECARFETLDDFNELVRVGYDTSGFEASWWEARYWRYWAAGDRICDALGAVDFGDDVLPAYQRVAERREAAATEVARVEAEIAAVHDVVRRHDQALARIDRLPEIYLEQCRAVLAEHLALADLPLLEQWLAPEGEAGRPVLVALRRIAGLRAKARVYEELQREGVEALLESLVSREAKYGRKQAKYTRPKYAYASFGDSDLDLNFEAKHAKLVAMFESLIGMLDAMDAYGDYERFSLANDEELWWREFTGRRPPRLLPRLRQWADRQPDARPVRGMLDDVADGDSAVGDAVAAAAMIDDDDRDYVS